MAVTEVGTVTEAGAALAEDEAEDEAAAEAAKKAEEEDGQDAAKQAVEEAPENPKPTEETGTWIRNPIQVNMSMSVSPHAISYSDSDSESDDDIVEVSPPRGMPRQFRPPGGGP